MSCPKANSTTSKHITNFVSTFNAVNRVFTNIALSNTWKDTMRMQYTVKKIYPQMKRIPKTIRGYNWSNRCLHEHCHASHRNILLNISIVNQSNNSFSWIDASEQISTSTHQYSGYATIFTRNFGLTSSTTKPMAWGSYNKCVKFHRREVHKLRQEPSVLSKEHSKKNSTAKLKHSSMIQHRYEEIEVQFSKRSYTWYEKLHWSSPP